MAIVGKDFFFVPMKSSSKPVCGYCGKPVMSGSKGNYCACSKENMIENIKLGVYASDE